MCLPQLAGIIFLPSIDRTNVCKYNNRTNVLNKEAADMFQGLTKGDFLQAVGGAAVLVVATYLLSVVFLSIV
jgi:hypothetical protein